MISVLVPVYNYDITALAGEILSQCQNVQIKYEIIFADDCSTSSRIADNNKKFLRGTVANYIEVKENMGRSKIRNFLAERAKGDILLFLDCDSGVVRKDFIEKYLQNSLKYDVVAGGTVYCNKKKVAHPFVLHWSFGKHREEEKRHFTTNNFLIKKEIFNSVRFNEKIKSYGHEDTLFGAELKEKGFSIGFTDNPVEHLGLKETDKFIKDTLCASKNLALLYKQKNYKPYLENITLIKAYKKIRQIYLGDVYCFFVELFQNYMYGNLHGKKPNLKYLDMIKLHTFFKTMEL